MVDIERNDPCPCGSGKKYKKCCLEKDRQKEKESLISTRNFENEFFDDEIDNHSFETFPYYDDYDEDDYYEDEDEDNNDGLYKKLNIKSISDESPEISEEEEAIVDDWWNKYQEMKNPDDIRIHLETFFSEHHKLVENLELQHEVLFELGTDYAKQGRHKEYIDFLLKVRSEFPETYLKSFGYYDRDIINYKLITNNKNEIPGFFEYFKEYPDHDPDNLFRVIDTLMANNCQDILLPFIKDIYYSVCLSPKIFGGKKILTPLVLGYYSPYLKQGFSENDLVELTNKLKEIKIDLDNEVYQPEYWKDKFHFIMDDFTNWGIKDCKTNNDIYDRYHEVSQNFMRFLKEKTGIDWMAAEFYDKMIYTYLTNVIPSGKRPKASEPFIFTKDSIDKTIVQTCKDFLWIDNTKSTGILNAIYYFADYLLQTENINKEKRDKIQQWCKELFEILYPVIEKQSFEAKIFSEFPHI